VWGQNQYTAFSRFFQFFFNFLFSAPPNIGRENAFFSKKEKKGFRLTAEHV
jgi:hypothetical protein